MSAAIEAGIEGIPAIGFSLLNYNWDANFEACKTFVKTITKNVLQHGLQEGIVLNVNIPDIAKTAIKGIKICRQARANWVEAFDKRKTPSGKDYYWLTGEFVNLDGGEDTDEWALEHNYVSVVPVKFDLTAHHAIQHLNTWNFNNTEHT
jgi:5'-nucleotidase